MENSRKEKLEGIHKFEIIPSSLREMAEALIGVCGSTIAQRLYRAAIKVERVSMHEEKVKPIQGELVAAAEAIEKGLCPPRLEKLSAFLNIPYYKEFLRKMPEEHRDEWRLLNDQLSRAKLHLKMFTSACWAVYRGPDATKTVALRLRGDEILSNDMSLLTVNATRVADSELMNTGFALLSVARLLDNLIGIILPWLFFCDSSDICELGTFTDCEAGDVYFTPFEDSPQDVKDAENAIDILKGAGWLIPGKYITPGGKTMIKNIADALKKLKKKVDQKKIELGGYGVYVVLKYKECVDGMCGNDWESKIKLVKIDPPAGKQHQLNKKGWKASVIEDLGEDQTKTDAQMDEFKILAENQCP